MIPECSHKANFEIYADSIGVKDELIYMSLKTTNVLLACVHHNTQLRFEQGPVSI